MKAILASVGTRYRPRRSRPPRRGQHTVISASILCAMRRWVKDHRGFLAAGNRQPRSQGRGTIDCRKRRKYREYHE